MWLYTCFCESWKRQKPLIHPSSRLMFSVSSIRSWNATEMSLIEFSSLSFSVVPSQTSSNTSWSRCMSSKQPKDLDNFLKPGLIQHLQCHPWVHPTEITVTQEVSSAWTIFVIRRLLVFKWMHLHPCLRHPLLHHQRLFIKDLCLFWLWLLPPSSSLSPVPLLMHMWNWRKGRCPWCRLVTGQGSWVLLPQGTSSSCLELPVLQGILHLQRMPVFDIQTQLTDHFLPDLPFRVFYGHNIRDPLKRIMNQMLLLLQIHTLLFPLEKCIPLSPVIIFIIMTTALHVLMYP